MLHDEEGVLLVDVDVENLNDVGVDELSVSLDRRFKSVDDVVLLEVSEEREDLLDFFDRDVSLQRLVDAFVDGADAPATDLFISLIPVFQGASSLRPGSCNRKSMVL